MLVGNDTLDVVEEAALATMNSLLSNKTACCEHAIKVLSTLQSPSNDSLAPLPMQCMNTLLQRALPVTNDPLTNLACYIAAITHDFE